MSNVDYDENIGFSVKAKNTEENQRIHDEFKAFCKHNCKDDRTIGLSLLLNHFNNYNKLLELDERVAILEGQVLSNQKEDEEEIEKQVI